MDGPADPENAKGREAEEWDVAEPSRTIGLGISNRNMGSLPGQVTEDRGE